MESRIAPQVDLGALTFRGLSVFSPLLQSLSADSVTPMAMIQMESLGAAFLVSGKYAAKVPDCLQRCSSVRLDRLALSIGWRKGDAASLMASSAGGQACALLSLCLFSLYGISEAGTVLLDLSQRLLPSTVAISSLAQLVDVGKLLKAKLETLGFGNQLAREVVKVYDVYKHLELDVPKDFLEPISAESMAELLANVSKALKDDSTLLRITGTCGLGHILGLVLMVFPQDTLVTINSIIIFEGTRRSIMIEFGDCGPSQFTLETVLHGTSQNNIPFAIETNPQARVPPYSFAWENWVADLLQLEFQAFGLCCEQELLIACCDLAIQLPAIMSTEVPIHVMQNPLPNSGLIQFMEPFPLQKMYNSCQTVLGVLPSSTQLDLQTAYSRLAAEVYETLRCLECSCNGSDTSGQCSFDHGWESNPSCKRSRLWDAIGRGIEHTLLCFLIDASPTVTVCRPFPGNRNFANEIVERQLGFGHLASSWISCVDLHWRMLNTFCYHRDGLVVSTGANTIFPQLIRDMGWTPGLRFELVTGQLIFNGRYYHSLQGHVVSPRQDAQETIPIMQDKIYPTSWGEHSDLFLTVRECLNHLELRATVRVKGNEIRLNLESIIIASYGLQETQ